MGYRTKCYNIYYLHEHKGERKEGRREDRDKWNQLRNMHVCKQSIHLILKFSDGISLWNICALRDILWMEFIYETVYQAFMLRTMDKDMTYSIASYHFLYCKMFRILTMSFRHVLSIYFKMTLTFPLSSIQLTLLIVLSQPSISVEHIFEDFNCFKILSCYGKKYVLKSVHVPTQKSFS